MSPHRALEGADLVAWRLERLEAGQATTLAEVRAVALTVARLDERDSRVAAVESGQRWWNRAVIGAVLTALVGLALELAKP